MTGRTIAIVILASAFAAQACAARTRRAPAPSVPAGDRQGIMDRAGALAGRGDHLYSSRYYEAALKRGASEEVVLPRLIVEQVKGGRLLAALDNTARLSAISRSPEEIVALHRLIEDLTGHRRDLSAEKKP